MSRSAGVMPSGEVDLKALVAASPYTQVSLAYAIGSSPNTISSILNHGHIPGRRIRKRLAAALGVSPTDIWPNHEEDD